MNGEFEEKAAYRQSVKMKKALPVYAVSTGKAFFELYRNGSSTKWEWNCRKNGKRRAYESRTKRKWILGCKFEEGFASQFPILADVEYYSVKDG